jgi:hypothetical protein
MERKGGGMREEALPQYVKSSLSEVGRMQGKIELIRQLLARAGEAQEQEEGQGVYIGGGVLFIILLIVLLVLIL